MDNDLAHRIEHSIRQMETHLFVSLIACVAFLLLALLMSVFQIVHDNLLSRIIVVLVFGIYYLYNFIVSSNIYSNNKSIIEGGYPQQYEIFASKNVHLSESPRSIYYFLKSELSDINDDLFDEFRSIVRKYRLVSSTSKVIGYLMIAIVGIYSSF